MHDLKNLKLKNTYVVMRHGQSEANVAGIIASNPAIGCNRYGLTDIGIQQVETALKNATGLNTSLNTGLNTALKNEVRIISSDFLRTKETANIAHNQLNSKHSIQFSEKLRERFFGDLNTQSDSHYQDVWTLDKDNADHQKYGVESANQVVTRATALITQLEEQFTGETFLLVAHGDVLQLLQTWFLQVPASQHRELPHLATAEIRCLNNDTQTTPVN